MSEVGGAPSGYRSIVLLLLVGVSLLLMLPYSFPHAASKPALAPINFVVLAPSSTRAAAPARVVAPPSSTAALAAPKQVVVPASTSAAPLAAAVQPTPAAAQPSPAAALTPPSPVSTPAPPSPPPPPPPPSPVSTPLPPPPSPAASPFSSAPVYDAPPACPPLPPQLVDGRRVYVVFGAQPHASKYSLSAVLSTTVWVQRFNVTPLVYLYDGDAPDPASPRITDPLGLVLAGMITAAGGVPLRLPARHFPPRKADMSATALQAVRLVAAMSSCLSPTDMLVTADSDVWPLSRRFWNRVLARNDTSRAWIFNDFLFYAKRAERSRNYAQMSYVMASVGRWRELYGGWVGSKGLPVLSPGTVLAPLAQVIDVGREFYGDAMWYSAEHHRGAQWVWDQVALGEWLTLGGLDRLDVNRGFSRLDRGGVFNQRGERTPEEEVERLSDVHLDTSSRDGWSKHVLQIWAALHLDPGVLDTVMEGVRRVSVTPRPTRATPLPTRGAVRRPTPVPTDSAKATRSASRPARATRRGVGE